ncbi:MAG TPA: hypothetical protein VNU25_02275 [Candidatus Paceibacterota bacterium]|nr:hypothetical protein [Candidatus Paceibacterota bacterium]
MRFLRVLLDLLFPPRDTEALVRDATVEDLGRHVRPQVSKDGRVFLMPYRTPLVRALIREAKFKDNEHAAQLLALALREYLESWLLDQEAYEAQSVFVVPIPLSKERLRERGYNQAERIARAALADLPGITVAPALARSRDTLPQTSLSRRKRLQNMAHAFRATEPVSGAHTYIVFDDVSTTGATLAAATRALFDAGARRCIALSLAH